MFNQSCIFCKIIARQAPASIIHEDSSIMSFLDIKPLHPGHVLIIPKPHYIDVFDIPENLLREVYASTKRISSAVKKATNAEGISLIQQNGAAAGQDIFHLHVHVVPRFEGVKLPRFSEIQMAQRTDLELMAQKIRQFL